MKRAKATSLFFLFAVLLFMPLSAQPKGEASVVSFYSGALIVKSPSNYGGWEPLWIIDERSDTGWACETGEINGNVFVIALPEKTTLKRVEFDTASIDGDGRGANNVLVEISDQSAVAGFSPLLAVKLKDRADHQSFLVPKPLPGRWLRLTLKDNHGDPEWTELMEFRGYGEQLTKTPIADVSGTYDSSFSLFHILKEDSLVTGCYELRGGTLSGGIDGRILKFQWRENGDSGPAILVFTPDGSEFYGLWWRKGELDQTPGLWNGKRQSKQVGSCPHWKPSTGVQKQMAEDLARFGRTRVYGINFDTDSAVIRAESKAVLDRIVTLLKADGSLKITVEGHTDNTGSLARNKALSQERADAVKAYLVKGGVDGARLRSVGYGSEKPVGNNGTAAGRAQNRRVELAKS